MLIETSVGKQNENIILLSDNEYNYFCLLDLSDNVIDIREQFPINREITTKIAEDLNITHPLDPTTQTPIVMTTDFFITLLGRLRC